MRILHLVQKPQRRGAEIFAHQLARAQRSLGHQVRTLYLYPYRGPGALPLEDGDRVLAGREDHPLEKVPGVHPGLLRRVLAAMAAFRPDVVQVNGARTVKYGAFARRLYPRAPWVLVYRNIGRPQDWVRTPYHGWFYRHLVMSRLDGVVGVSRETLQAVEAFYDVSVPMACIPNGVVVPAAPPSERLAVRHATDTPGDAAVLLFVGSLSVEKRPDRFLRVAAQLALPGVQVYAWLVGDGPWRARLQQQAAALGLAERVRFLGVQADVFSPMAAADLLLLTSDTEGLPGVILEAGAVGLPVVAGRVGGVPECVRDGETGLLVDPQDEAGFVAAVRALLAAPDRRAAMGRRARDWVVEEFEMGQIAQRYLAFYAQVLADKGRCTGISKAR